MKNAGGNTGEQASHPYHAFTFALSI